jgi:hypothetical protein
MKKIAGCMFLLCAMAMLTAEAQEKKVLVLEDILGAQTASELQKDHRLFRMLYKEDNYKLLYYPKTELGKQALSAWKQENPPAFVGELLYLIDKRTLNNDIDRASLVMRAISTMEGIKYYSNTRRKIETLYPFCYMIDDPVKKNRIPDVLGVVENKQYYFYQKDNSLGTCVYAINFAQTDTELSILATNLDSLKVFFITGVKERNLQIYISISDTGSDFLMYVLVQSIIPPITIIENIMTKSFSSRADALSEWFKDNYQKTR